MRKYAVNTFLFYIYFSYSQLFIGRNPWISSRMLRFKEVSNRRITNGPEFLSRCSRNTNMHGVGCTWQRHSLTGLSPARAVLNSNLTPRSKSHLSHRSRNLHVHPHARAGPWFTQQYRIHTIFFSLLYIFIAPYELLFHFCMGLS